MVHVKNWRVSLCVQELYYPQDFFEFLQPFRFVRTQRVVPVYIMVSVFFLVLDFWLAWAIMEHSVLFVQHLNLTEVPDRNSFPLRSFFYRVSLSLNTVVVGEVDEPEEDVG